MWRSLDSSYKGGVMEPDRQLVVKSNHIIEASYRLSVAEQRVILSAIAQVRRDQPKVTDAVLYSVTAAELAETKRVLRRIIELSGADVPIGWRIRDCATRS